MKVFTFLKMNESVGKKLLKSKLYRLGTFAMILGLTSFSFGQTVTTTLANGTGESYFNPIAGSYSYSYSQQIYLATDFNAAVQGQPNRITKIRFYYVGDVFANSNNWTIYMGNTTQDRFFGNAHWIPLANMERVFTGILPNPVAGSWMEITLATPFQWNGTSNVAVAVNEAKPGYSSMMRWRSNPTSERRSICYVSDNANPSLIPPPKASITDANVPQAQFVHEIIGPLPVSLTDFNAQIAGKRKVEISWVTHSESNNDYFTVERSSDAEHFRAIGEPIDGAGNSSNLLQYVVHDLDPTPGVNYYRLKQTDFNGEYTYSEIRSVSFAENWEAVKLFPNPASNGAALQIKTTEETEVFVQISASNGEIVETVTQHLEAGGNTVYLGKFLKAGVYNVSVRDQQFLNENLKLVVIQ